MKEYKILKRKYSITKESFNLATKRFIFVFFAALVFLIVGVLIFGPDYNPDVPFPSDPIKFKELPVYLNKFFIISVGLALVAFALKIFQPVSEHNDLKNKNEA